MVNVTVEFWNAGKIIHKSFSQRRDAQLFLCRLNGSNFVGYLDDGTFAIYVGMSDEERNRPAKQREALKS